MTFPPDLVSTLRSARAIVALTGAGVSAESGVPTFRDAQTGHWTRFKPEELATPEAFRRDPRPVWEWYDQRRQQVRTRSPNPGHLALAVMQRLVPQLVLVTQNVDGLHQRAGSDGVVELHGNILRTKCFEEDAVVESWPETSDVPPRCPRCGGLLRPDVVWFGEMLPLDKLASAESACDRCDVFLSVGTSSLVYPAAGLAHRALSAGAVVVEVNPSETPLTPLAHHSLRGLSGVLLPSLVKEVWSP
jgi:NAD-dependent deacetylase